MRAHLPNWDEEGLPLEDTAQALLSLTRQFQGASANPSGQLRDLRIDLREKAEKGAAAGHCL